MKYFTYYTIIGRDINFLKWHIKNIREYAGFNELLCEKEIIVIVYKNSQISNEITQSILNYCKEENIRIVLYEEQNQNFIDNLYDCWNLGYIHSRDGYVFRGGSDQVFSRNGILKLYELAEELDVEKNKITLQANTIECASRLKMINAKSRHFECDFGNSYDDFDYNAFENFIVKIKPDKSYLDINESLQFWGHPTLLATAMGGINRCDGCSWLMTKREWEEYGPIPPFLDSDTGDVVIHNVLQENGFKQYIVSGCVTYHFVQGERT